MFQNVTRICGDATEYITLIVLCIMLYIVLCIMLYQHCIIFHELDKEGMDIVHICINLRKIQLVFYMYRSSQDLNDIVLLKKKYGIMIQHHVTVIRFRN